MGRFQSTVPYYARFRPPYDDSFFAAVARRLALTGAERLLDLGTGPGLLALGFAPFVAETVGVDPEPAMLAAARAAAAATSAATRWIEGRAETLDPATLGLFEVVTIGRALHWMEPAPTRDALDRIVTRGGSIVTCAASSVPDGRNPWLETYDALRRRWSSDSPRMNYAERDAFFAGTRFIRSGEVSVETERRVSIDHLVDRVLSMSSSAPDKIGTCEPELRRELADALASFATAGMITDVTAARAEIFQANG